MQTCIGLKASVEEALNDLDAHPERYIRIQQSEDLLTTYVVFLIPCAVRVRGCAPGSGARSTRVLSHAGSLHGHCLRRRGGEDGRR